MRRDIKKQITLMLLALMLSGCAALVPKPTPTPTLPPTNTPTFTPPPTSTPTKTPTPTITPTPDAAAKYSSRLPGKPGGFEWEILEDLHVAVLVPDGWYFKIEDREELQFDGFYITRENIDEVGRFTTGFTMFIISDLDDPEQYGIDFLNFQISLDTTVELIGAWDYDTGYGFIRHIEIISKFPYETEINQNKTIHYFAFVYDDTLYYGIFESPTSEWDQAKKDYGANIMDHLVVFGE